LCDTAEFGRILVLNHDGLQKAEFALGATRKLLKLIPPISNSLQVRSNVFSPVTVADHLQTYGTHFRTLKTLLVKVFRGFIHRDWESAHVAQEVTMLVEAVLTHVLGRNVFGTHGAFGVLRTHGFMFALPSRPGHDLATDAHHGEFRAARPHMPVQIQLLWDPHMTAIRALDAVLGCVVFRNGGKESHVQKVNGVQPALCPSLRDCVQRTRGGAKQTLVLGLHRTCRLLIVQVLLQAPETDALG